MKSKLFLAALLLLLTSCSHSFYSKQKWAQPVGIDFSQGRWLIGNISAGRGLSVELADIVLKDFSKYAKGGVKSAINETSLLLATDVPLNPGEDAIEDLKKVTGFDYYINIKCEDKQKYESNLHHQYPMTYTEKMTYGIVTLEVYDLNKGEIIYSQTVVGKSHENLSFTTDLPRRTILGSYKKIFKEIKKKYT